MTDDLVAFLRARYDEDEQVARAVEDNSAPWHGEWVNDNNWAIKTYNGWVLAYMQGEQFRPGFAEHVARHDPARVLAEVDAKRRILDECKPIDVTSIAKPNTEHVFGTPWGERIVRLLALPYAEHADYREEWRP